MGKHLDILHFDPKAKAPELDYQWFAVSTMGVARDFPPSDGWVPVLRAYMPDEQSDHDEVIARREMRLFMRLKTLSDAETEFNAENALQQARSVLGERAYEALAGNIANHGYPGLDGPIRIPIPISDFAPAPMPWDRTKARIAIVDHRRGRLLILPEDALKPWLARVAARFWQMLVAVRVVYLMRDEREMADRQGTSYGDWAWAKIDLLRDGTLRQPYRINLCGWKRSAKRR